MSNPVRRGLPIKTKLAIWSAILIVVALSCSVLILVSKSPGLSIGASAAIVFVGLIVFWFVGPLVVWFALWWLSKVTNWWDTAEKSEDDG